MSMKCAVVLQRGADLPERGALISRAWGDVPTSYFQDEEDLNVCSFLDLKINKWEINIEWSRKQIEEPWIRIELLKGRALAEYLRNEACPPPVNANEEILLLFELDDGGSELDEMLLIRLVSVFFGVGKLYHWCDGFREISESAIAALPPPEAVRKRLLTCK